MILSLDPSSTVVGWAHVSPGGALRAAGVITPDAGRLGSYRRIRGLCRDLRALLDEICPDTVLIEWTKGKVGRRHQGLGAGLAVYGAGLGACAAEVEHWVASCRPAAVVVPILENDWTRGVTKASRTAAIAALYPEYSAADDPGGDLADAIGLARWYLREALVRQ